MSVPKKLLNYLDAEKVKYELVEHRTVFTAWDMAATLHVKPAQIIKTLVVKLKGKVPVLVLIPAHKNLDKKKFGNVAFNAVSQVYKKMASSYAKASADKKDDDVVPREWGFPPQELKGKSYKVDFAKEKWMKEKLIGKIGATPPFGRLLKMPVFMDKALLKEKDLILNSGDYNVAIKMKAKDFEKLEQPLTCSFSVKK